MASALLLSVGIQAQEWIFGSDAINFPVAAGIATGGTVVIKGLTITANGTVANMGQIEASAKTFGTNTYINRFKFNGGGYTGAASTQNTPTVFTPTQRFISFPVTGNSTITAYGVTGSSTDVRRLFVTDGSTLVGTMVMPLGSAVTEGIVDYKGSATTLYMYCNASVNLYYLKVAPYQSPSITSFSFPVTNVTTIITAAGTVTSKVPYGTDLTAMVPTITLTTGAGNTVSPATGVAANFSTSGITPVNYTVSDGTNSKVYAVSVVAGQSLDITSFTVSGVTATIDPVGLTINATVPLGTDLTTLQPAIALAGASTTVAPLSGVTANFATSVTTPLSYTVTDGTFTKVYKVTIVQGTTAIAQVSISGISFDGRIIHNDANLDLRVFDLTGRLVVRSLKNIDMSSSPKGVYVVKSNSGSLKIVL